jgi:hypothetical protein
MDGDLRYEIVRDHLEARREHARSERSIRAARIGRQARTADSGWSSGIVAVVGGLTRRTGRRPISA